LLLEGADMVAQVVGTEERRDLPPSERAFEVYRLIEVDGLSTRTVAQQVGLSQTRVVQLRDAVEHWVARQPSATSGLTKQQRLQAAEYKAGLRLDHLYSLALEAFRQSQGPEATSEETIRGGRVVKTRYSHGNTRYLVMAMRIATQQSRIPTVPIVEESGPEDELNADVVPAAAIPPEEDCSPAGAQQEHSDVAAAPASAANAVATESSAAMPSKGKAVSEPFAADLGPVQSDLRAAGRDPFKEPVLTRKQRKRRARMLLKAK